MSKRICAIATLACVVWICTDAVAVDLYSNQSANPSVAALNRTAASNSGVAAPAGAFWSECEQEGALPQANTVAGFTVFQNNALTSNFRAADNFTVPAPGWKLQGASFFAYRTGNTTLTSPFAETFVQIWNGRPGDVGSSVVFGDLVTNRQASTTFSGVYRIFSTSVGAGANPPTPPGTTRGIFENRVNLPDVDLVAGTYWIEWTYGLTVDTFTSFSPATTHEGTRSTVPGPGDGRQQTGAGAGAATWVNIIDNGQEPTGAPLAPDLPQDFPFLLRGEIIPEPGCLALMGIAGMGLIMRRRRA